MHKPWQCSHGGVTISVLNTTTVHAIAHCKELDETLAPLRWPCQNGVGHAIIHTPWVCVCTCLSEFAIGIPNIAAVSSYVQSSPAIMHANGALVEAAARSASARGT